MVFCGAEGWEQGGVGFFERFVLKRGFLVWKGVIGWGGPGFYMFLWWMFVDLEVLKVVLFRWNVGRILMLLVLNVDLLMDVWFFR